MPVERLLHALAGELAELERSGTRKGAETVTRAVVPGEGDRGPRYVLDGEGDRRFLRMNSNGYLGMALRREVIEAEEQTARELGTGPQAVRFISGTHRPHVELEGALARFHGREAAMIFSSAYAALMGVLPPLVTPETAVISDALNHSCIINAVRLARPREKTLYPHLDMDALQAALQRAAAAGCRRALVVTDGVFSMRGDFAPLERVAEIARHFDEHFPENVVTIVDDSHGVGAFGATGRGSEEVTGGRCDILAGTLGKALGVNGGYAVGDPTLIEFLREKSPFYVYSNPITPAEAAAAHAALAIVDSDVGRDLLAHLRVVTERFTRGLSELGFETIPGPHPVVPLMVRDTETTRALVRHLRGRGILATGLAHPVVPRGDEEIRFQLCSDHTAADVDEVLQALSEFQPTRTE
jgi:glycine C-acetyltransferase